MCLSFSMLFFYFQNKKNHHTNYLYNNLEIRSDIKQYSKFLISWRVNKHIHQKVFIEFPQRNTRSVLDKLV